MTRMRRKRMLPQMESKLHCPAKLSTSKGLENSIHESAERLDGCATSDVHSLHISQQYHELLSGVAAAKTFPIKRSSKTS